MMSRIRVAHISLSLTILLGGFVVVREFSSLKDVRCGREYASHENKRESTKAQQAEQKVLQHEVRITENTTKTTSTTTTTTTATSTVLPGSKDTLCPKVSPLLTGPTHITFEGPDDLNWPPTLEEIAQQNQGLQPGGIYPGPTDCKPRSKVAIIIPYRDREEHLRYNLHYLHGILQRQQLQYIVVVVEQDNDYTFNKGLLMNLGFQYVMNSTNFTADCFFFHDVDTLSENDRTLYLCKGDSEVVHLSARLDKYNYRLCCGVTVGGVLGLKPQQFIKINGYSNKYCGWGGEDDDINARIRHVGGFSIFRPNKKYNNFKMISHQHDQGNPVNGKRLQLLKAWGKRQPKDGVNSLEKEDIKIVKQVTHTRLYVRSRDCAAT
nr:beta-1,4-galactosyltransferase 3-like [Ciona intestinalis]|eukprot:XP_002124765.3 beta-1,4-galactosyltransferase 3-like [Ciona intestinalis]